MPEQSDIWLSLDDGIRIGLEALIERIEPYPVAVAGSISLLIVAFGLALAYLLLHPRHAYPDGRQHGFGQAARRPRRRPDITMPRPRPRPAAGPPPSGGRRSRLSEVLRRASRDDLAPPRPPPLPPLPPPPPERSPREPIEPPDWPSADLDRTIDLAAAAELWDRNQHGERGPAGRRPHPVQGQEAFEEIRRKYRTDRDFKDMVDRYVAEFERLLDEAAYDDRGEAVARTCLNSETGKVYTLLAQATGRLE